MSKPRATLKDIATKLNISISTVSRALNDHPAINQKTKRSVKSTAKKLNYYPNLLALNLLQKKSNTIGVVVPEITSHFFSSVITGIQDILRPSNYNMIICQSEESYKDEVEIVENLMRVGVDGILVSPSSSTKNFEHFRRLKKSGIPIVVFDRDCPGLEVDKVLVDDYDGAFQAVDYLIKSGCKRIAHIGGPLNLSTTKHRLEGYLDALKENDIPIDKKYIKHVKGFTHEDGIKPAKSLLKLENKPDAIFAVNDCIAISAMYAAKMLKLKIPEEISIIGFDDEPHSSYFTPELSTVWQPVYSMGMLSARILLKRISNTDEKQKLREEIFKPELVIRASSKKI
ncbi:LacI family DNA-binding transcriptional regulator [Aestuariivivens sediminis]|uniref:LacI family DNA-binding transcriptional regulator n=1 Tax=Aestuariivivens sediminis TaxID=2913557 RepID=UPI001F58ADE7|nr:LacI family DNA-binding transcriptional regulator [Aestuariivivens sediminis]